MPSDADDLIIKRPPEILATQVAVLAERVENSQRSADRRMDAIEKKLDDALGRYATKDELKIRDDQIAKLQSYVEWIVKIFGALIAAAIFTAVFKSGLLHA